MEAFSEEEMMQIPYAEGTVRSCVIIRMKMVSRRGGEIEVYLADSRGVIKYAQRGEYSGAKVMPGRYGVVLAGFDVLERMIKEIEMLHGVKFLCLEEEGQPRMWLHPDQHALAMQGKLPDMRYPEDSGC